MVQKFRQTSLDLVINHNILGLTSILDIWSESTLEMSERTHLTSKW